MKKNYKFSSIILIAFLQLGSFANAQFTNGVFIINEGGFGTNGASVSFLSANNELENNVFGIANQGNALGDTAEAIGFHGDFAYIVLNGSNAVQVVNAQTFQLVNTINVGLTNPRFIAFNGSKAYITCWGDGINTTDDYVAVIDINSNTIVSNIAVVEGPERIISEGSNLYVAHQGGYGYGNSVSKIDAQSQLVTNIPVGDVPNSLVVNNGSLYVLCGGNPFFAPVETDGSLVKIDLITNEISATIPFVGLHPANFEIYNEQMYYSIAADIFVADLTATTLPTMPLLSISEQGAYGIYGMDFIDDKLYVADAGDYASPGKAYVFSNTGNLLQTYTVGVIPSNFYKAQNSLGVDKNLAVAEVNLYPNPSSERFYINTKEISTIKMFDLSGRLVRNQQYSDSGVEVGNLKSGIYLVEITNANATITKKISVK